MSKNIPNKKIYAMVISYKSSPVLQELYNRIDKDNFDKIYNVSNDLFYIDYDFSSVRYIKNDPKEPISEKNFLDLKDSKKIFLHFFDHKKKILFHQDVLPYTCMYVLLILLVVNFLLARSLYLVLEI